MNAVIVLILIAVLVLFYIMFVAPELKNAKMIKRRTEDMSPNQALAFKFFAERIGWFGRLVMNRKRTEYKDFNYVLEMKIKKTCSLERALDKLGITESSLTIAEPVLLKGYDYDRAMTYVNEYGGESTCIREVYFTDSSKWVSDAYQIAYVVFTERQLFLYTCSFSSITDNVRETTREFFYKDVTSVSTNPITFEFRKGGKDVVFETEAFCVVVPGAQIKAAINGTKNSEEVVNGMKALLRKKK